MIKPPIDVTAKGTVILGSKVTCDGFVYGVPYRIQTHVHTDHMEDFSTSKGYQDIFMSRGTRDLLIADQGADLPYRSNIFGVELSTPIRLDDIVLELVPSEHMLGAVQAKVITPDGWRLGYSSDFKWPLESTIEVDALVIDSTYGSPDRRRYYSQSEVNEQFLELVSSKVRRGPVIIYGFRGTLERALTLLEGDVNAPIVASRRMAKELSVYRKHGRPTGEFVEIDSDGGRQAIADNRYIRIIRKGEELPETNIPIITLSAFMSNSQTPLIEYSPVSYSLAMTDHADFDGTLSYIQATGARYVVTDNTRGGNAVTLATEIRNRLGIEAIPSSNSFRWDWGS